MKTGIFIGEVDREKRISIPDEIVERLAISEGDKIEILLKKIRSKRFEVTIHKNPLVKILDLTYNKEQEAE